MTASNRKLPNDLKPQAIPQKKSKNHRLFYVGSLLGDPADPKNQLPKEFLQKLADDEEKEILGNKEPTHRKRSTISANEDESFLPFALSLKQ